MLPGGKRQILFLGRSLGEETVYRSISDTTWARFVALSASLWLSHDSCQGSDAQNEVSCLNYPVLCNLNIFETLIVN